jgi:hypothetical protein
VTFCQGLKKRAYGFDSFQQVANHNASDLVLADDAFYGGGKLGVIREVDPMRGVGLLGGFVGKTDVPQSRREYHRRLGATAHIYDEA